MEFPDLHRFPKTHPPSPYGAPVPIVKSGDGVLPKGLTLRAVGWLEKEGFATGKTPKVCVQLLLDGLKYIFSDGYRGVHSCSLCGRTRFDVRWGRMKISLLGHGHYLVQLKRVVYMAPELLLHYILDHGYRPPEEFLEALEKGRFLTEDDLVVRWKAQGEI